MDIINSAKALVFVSERLPREAHHRVDLVFRCELVGAQEELITEEDAFRQGVEWLSIEELEDNM